MYVYEIYCGAIVGTLTYNTEREAEMACQFRKNLSGRDWRYRLILLDTEGLS